MVHILYTIQGAFQMCNIFRGGHSGNKPASTVVPMVSYGILKCSTIKRLIYYNTKTTKHHFADINK
jgi:hypothetical protein